jgi:uncharacterized membrane protein
MSWAETVAYWIEAAGVAVMVIGGIAATVRTVLRLAQRVPWDEVYHAYRSGLGRAILLGLEFLVAGDIIATITVDLTLESAGALGIIVLIRTLLSFSLETEIDGRLPWRKAEAESRSA